MFTLIDALERKPKGKPDMSPHAVNNFVSDLVLMAQAMEKLPQVEESLRIANEFLEMERETVKARDADIAQAKAYASTLEQRLHDAEVAKDAAETMFLEADERTSRALDFIKATFGNAGTLIQALEPPRPQPEPVVEPKPEPDHVAIHSWTDQPEPTVSEVKPITEQERTEIEAIPMQSRDHQIGDILSKGQSEPDPTPAVDTLAPQSNSAPMQSASSQEPVTGETQPSPGPYSGKRYLDIPTYVQLDAWLAGGGTEADYHYRPQPYQLNR